jgi:hypothetical protein
LLGVHVSLRDIYNIETNQHNAKSVEKKLNSELRKIHSFFHLEIFEEMMQVNALKGRVDHENGTNAKQTWSSLADLYNCVDLDDGMYILDFECEGDHHKHLLHEPAFAKANLTDFAHTPAGSAELKRYFHGLFKFRHKITDLLGESGTHNNDPMSYVDTAKVKERGSTSFICKCEENPRVDTEFVVSMPSEFKGTSTNDMHDDIDSQR